MPGQAAYEYNRLLELHPALVAESRRYLIDRLDSVRFVFGGRMLSPYLRPHFVTTEEWRRITQTCETVWSAIDKVGRALPNDPLIETQIGLTGGERELTSVDPGYP